MIVNNSAQQPDGVGHRFLSFSKGDSLLSVSVDSMAYLFCMSLGKAIAESPLFYDVRICEDTLRRDSLFYNSRPLTADEVVSFCNDYGVDALITLDKMFFNTVFYETDMKNFVMGNGISADVSGELRALWPGQKTVYSIPFSDSLMWLMDENHLFGEVIEVLTTPDVKLAIQYLSEFTGQKIHVNFVPFWSDDKRWFYTNISSQWKQATVYAAGGKWEAAAKIWEPLFDKTKKWKPKARLASNLALCYEMTGNFNKAVEYAEISYGLFNEFAGSTYTGVQSTYLDILKKRVTADQILSEQLRER
jgi:hypothetical protein